jgi:hypothetical protein
MRRISSPPRPEALRPAATDLKDATKGASSRSSDLSQNKKGGHPHAPASLLAEIESLDSAVLRKRWRSLLRTSAPRNLSRSLLIRIIAWREQVNAVGDLDKASLSILEAAVSKVAAVASSSCADSQLRPGVVLVREHAGILHRVAVLADGFAWNGKTFCSLSAVARAITGVNWNGPRFFGLDRSDAKPVLQSGGRKRRPRGNAPSASSLALPTQPPEDDLP